MKYEYEITKKEVFAAARCHRRTYRWIVVRPVLGTLCISVFVLYILFPAKLSLSPFILLLLGLYLLFANRLYENRLAKQLSKVLIGQYTLEIDDKIMKVKDNDSSSEVALTKIKCAIETHDVLILYISRISFIVFPTSMFQNDLEQEEFISLFPRNIKPGNL